MKPAVTAVLLGVIQVLGAPGCCTVVGATEGGSGSAGSPGQQSAGLTPELFEPGVVSTEEYSEAGCTFTPDGKALYFTRSGGGLKSPTIFLSRLEDGRWTESRIAPLEGFGPQISPDGKKIFVSKVGLNEENQRIPELWFGKREGGAWSDLRYIGHGLRPSVSESLNLYHIGRAVGDDRGVIVVRRFIDGKYSEPELLGGGVNTSHYEVHPCIAGDDSYLIFDADRPGGYGKGDLYVSFRKDDGTWGDAVNLGPAINTEGYEGYSSISPDGKYLFYSSDKDGSFNLYRVGLEIIEEARK